MIYVLGITDLLKKAEKYNIIKFCYPSDKLSSIAIANIQSAGDDSQILDRIFVNKIKSEADKLIKLRTAIINSDKYREILSTLETQVSEYETIITNDDE